MSIITLKDILYIEKLKEIIIECCENSKMFNSQQSIEYLNNCDCVKELKRITTDIVLRVFKKFELLDNKVFIDFEPYNFKNTLENFYDTDSELGNSSDGFITLKLLYNLSIINDNANIIYNLNIDNFNYNWTLNLLNTILHETFHCVQDTLFEKFAINDLNLENLPDIAKESYLNRVTNIQIKQQVGLFEICEISARKFALEEMLNFYENNFKTSITKQEKELKTKFEIFLSKNIISESENCFNLLKNARQCYLLNFKEKFNEYINKYYDDIEIYYKEISDKTKEIESNILKNKAFNSIKYLGLKELFCLYVEYKEFNNLSSKNEKDKYLKIMEEYNKFCFKNNLEGNQSNLSILLNEIKYDLDRNEKSGN